MYASIHPDYEYEKIRIPYMFDNKNCVYIVDFVDTINKILIEIKPVVHLTNTKTTIKLQTAVNWGKINGYDFQIITEQYFVDNFTLIDFDNITIPNLREKIARIKYEANKKN